MNFQQAKKKLESISQVHLLGYWHSLSAQEQASLLQQIAQINVETYGLQKALLAQTKQHKATQIVPITDYETSGNQEDITLGFQTIQKGELGALIVAGGQGTRLKFPGPKGMYPITFHKKKTLYQLFAEKTAAASHQAGVPLHLAMMTSPTTFEQTSKYFQSHQSFGLLENQLSIFAQGKLPLLDNQGNLFLEDRASIAMGPDGNGSSLHYFVTSGIWDQWHQKGVKYLHFLQVDNPLCDPFDAELLGYHQRHHAEITIQCVKRVDPDEKVGLLVKKDNHIRIIEYSEISKTEQNARDNSGNLKYPLANMSSYIFNMSFVKKIAEKFSESPLHAAHKTVPCLDSTEETIHPEIPNARKFEYFIFDILESTENVKWLCFPRQSCFSPLKNFSGPYSPETVQQDLIASDQRVLEKVTGKKSPDIPIEISQEFYYPTQEFIKKWRGKTIPVKPFVH